MAVETQSAPRTAVTSQGRRGLTRKQVREILRQVLTHAALIPAAFLFLLPFLWMLSTSNSTPTPRSGFPIR
jgi:ABC-type glycerol-3-phosphate transport system permease component